MTTATIGARLADLRKAAGLTQSELAELAGITQSRVSDIERGAVVDPQLSTLRRIAAALGGDDAWRALMDVA